MRSDDEVDELQLRLRRCRRHLCVGVGRGLRQLGDEIQRDDALGRHREDLATTVLFASHATFSILPRVVV